MNVQALKIAVNENKFNPGLSWEEKLITYHTETEDIYREVMVKTILEGDETRPIAVAMTDKAFMIMFCDEEEFEKDAFHAFIGAFCKKMEAKRLFYIGEVWYVKADNKKELDMSVMPSRSPNKREALMTIHFNLEDKTSTSKIEEIVRSNGTVALIEDEETGKADGMTGKLADLIFKPDGTVVLQKMGERKSEGEQPNETIN